MNLWNVDGKCKVDASGKCCIAVLGMLWEWRSLSWIPNSSVRIATTIFTQIIDL
jgi:hypothetical protein